MSVDADLCDRIRRIFWHKLNLEVPSIDADLIETGVLDSMHLVDLLLHLEREFQTSVSLEDLEIDNFRTIEDIASFIANKKQLRPLTIVESPRAYGG
jgi:acyl carrier protein